MAVKTTEQAGRSAQASAPGRDAEGRLFLIDGPSLVYRAFYALPESIATSTGEPTNAIFGFASMLVKIVTEYGVRPTVVAWDAGTSGRTELFADYKSTRRSRPDLLKAQWPAMEPLVQAFGYRNVKLDGYEADDVIASLAERARAAGLSSMIVTGDRDVFQLIDPDGLVKVMATSRGITDTKIYDHQAVIDRYGIAPELIPDFYGLKGDTSDNIPGVPGIGDKTASELIQSYGSLEGVLGHIRDIGGAKRKQNLIDHGEDARISKLLATVQRDLDIDLDLDEEVAREPDRSRLREFFRRYELRDPLRRLEEALGEDELVAGDLASPRGRGQVARAGALGAPADIAGFATGDALCVVVRESRSRPRAPCSPMVRPGALRSRRRPPIRGCCSAPARGEDRRRDCGRGVAGAPRPRVAPSAKASKGGSANAARRGARRRLCRPGGDRRRVRRAASGRARRQGPAHVPDCSSTTRCSAPTCWSPRGAAIRSRSCARSAACVRCRGPRGGRRGAARSACRLAARADLRARPGSGDGRDRAAARAGAARDGADRGAPEPRPAGGDHRARARGDTRARRGNLRARRRPSS